VQVFNFPPPNGNQLPQLPLSQICTLPVINLLPPNALCPAGTVSAHSGAAQNLFTSNDLSTFGALLGS
jgi:hypothetical protein